MTKVIFNDSLVISKNSNGSLNDNIYNNLQSNTLIHLET